MEQFDYNKAKIGQGIIYQQDGKQSCWLIIDTNNDDQKITCYKIIKQTSLTDIFQRSEPNKYITLQDSPPPFSEICDKLCCKTNQTRRFNKHHQLFISDDYQTCSEYDLKNILNRDTHQPQKQLQRPLAHVSNIKFECEDTDYEY